MLGFRGLSFQPLCLEGGVGGLQFANWVRWAQTHSTLQQGRWSFLNPQIHRISRFMVVLRGGTYGAKRWYLWC